MVAVGADDSGEYECNYRRSERGRGSRNRPVAVFAIASSSASRAYSSVSPKSSPVRAQKQALDRQSPGLDFDDDLNIAIGRRRSPGLGAQGLDPRVSDATWCNATRICSSSSCSCSWWSDILVPSQTGLPATVMQAIWAQADVDAGCVARGPRQFVVWCRCGEPLGGAPSSSRDLIRDPGSSE